MDPIVDNRDDYFLAKVDLLLMAARFLEMAGNDESSVFLSLKDSPIMATTVCKTTPKSNDDLCVVCGDRTTGIHYHVLACEGCKGFFRRSIRSNLLYTCYKHNTCIVDKISRNRCQACRLAKCLRLGMCPSAVRPDRIKRKPEGAKTVNEERANALAKDIVRAHSKSFFSSPVLPASSTQEPKQEFKLGNEVQLWSTQSDFSGAAARRIVQFAQDIPAFAKLPTKDRKLLIEQGITEIMVFRASTRYVPDKDCLVLPNWTFMSMSQVRGRIGDLSDTIKRLARILIDLNLNATELALFEAIILFSPDRLGCKEIGSVYELFDDVRNTLRTTMRERRQGKGSTAFSRLFKAYCDIRCDTFVHWQKKPKTDCDDGALTSQAFAFRLVTQA